MCGSLCSDVQTDIAMEMFKCNEPDRHDDLCLCSPHFRIP